jgi:hypothetical protein
MKKMLAFAVTAIATMNFANASVFTMSSTGTVYNGVDTLGLFGTPGRKLDKLPFSLTVSVELDGTVKYSNVPLQYSQLKATTPYVVALSIGGVDYVTSATSGDQSTAALINSYSNNQGGSVDGGSLFDSGYDALGRWVYVRQLFHIYGLRSTSLTQYLQIGSGDANADFQVGSGSNSSYFHAYGPIMFTINGTPATLPEPVPEPVPVANPAPVPHPAPVPEPASAMLFGAGLLGLAALRRRQSWR